MFTNKLDKTETEAALSKHVPAVLASQPSTGSGALIVNADDWGRDRETTNRIFECIRRRTVSSVSGMVFMADSTRAAAIARDHAIDAGLHLNLTLPFTGPDVPGELLQCQRQVATYLLRRRVNQAIFHPGLKGSFKYVVEAQLEEYTRLYGVMPASVDGHHHMHLCANVLLDELLPAGTSVRRNFSYVPGEKGFVNRLYRKFVDRWLARRYRLTDFFFALTPFEPSKRLQRIFSLSHNFIVEVETHPCVEEEYLYLTGNEFLRLAEALPLATHYARRSDGTKQYRNRFPAKRVEQKQESLMVDKVKHITVCVCTYKRPTLLKRLLQDLDQQETDGRFTFSIAIVDNDRLKSAENVVSNFATASNIPITYAVVPEQNISLARNKAIESAHGDFVAFIDDDEFPIKRWLISLFEACENHEVEGVLGPVKRHFDVTPPKWVLLSKFYDRKTYPTGTTVHWRAGRTGNVLLKRNILAGMPVVFRPEFRGGEDTDFFSRMIDKGCKFVWCDEAVAYEVIPPVRWNRAFLIKRAFLRGANAIKYPSFGIREIVKSVLAVPLYSLGLPFAFVLGQHRFMGLLVKLCDHLGKLLALLGINLIKEYYVME